MLSSSRKKRHKPGATSARALSRKSLTDRLSNMPGLSKLSHHDSAKTSVSAGTKGHSGPGQALAALRLPPPNRRFVECTEEDLRVSEVGELLREYQRLVEAVRSLGGFDE
ncbi:hypothetical protein ID866_10607 [Astraeus odoratus]|nr:hypothetical protein ID866_10607 [Astraeus odoratus]